VYDYIMYSLYYILAYIQHNGDISLENYCCRVPASSNSTWILSTSHTLTAETCSQSVWFK